MNTKLEFQMVCGSCGGLSVKIDDPERACREAIVYCSNCGASRGTMGSLRDLAERSALHVTQEATNATVKPQSRLVALHHELQGLRRRAERMNQAKIGLTGPATQNGSNP